MIRCFFSVILLLLFSLGIALSQENIKRTSLSLSDFLEAYIKKNNIQINYEKSFTDNITIDDTYLSQINNSSFEELCQLYRISVEKLDNTLLLVPEVESKRTICGYVQSALDSTALSFANVYIDSYNGTQTDFESYFELEITAYPSDQLTISYLGFNEKQIVLSDYSEGVCPTIYLDVSEYILDNKIVISDYLINGIHKSSEYNATKFNFENSLVGINILENDILKTAQILPGITSADESAANINIRGASPDQTLFVWEDVPLYNAGHFFGMISNINPFVISDMEIYKGVFKPDYANRVGGVIDMSMAENIDRPKLEFGTTATESHGIFQTSLLDNKINLNVSGRVSNYNLTEQNPTYISFGNKVFQSTKVEEAIEFDEEVQFNMSFYDFNAKLNYNITDNLKLSVAHLKSNNNFRYNFELEDEGIGSMDSLNTNTVVWSNKLEYHLSDNSEINLSYSHSSYENDYLYELFSDNDDFDEGTETSFNSITEQVFKASHKSHINKSQLEWGYIRERKEVAFNIFEQYAFQSEIDSFADTEAHFNNLYAASSIVIDDKWTIDPSVKFIHYSQLDLVKFSPRLNINYQYDKHLNFNLSGGRLIQFISQVFDFSTDQLNINNPVWIIADEENMSVIEADKISIGASYRKKSWLIDIEAYSNNITGLSFENRSANGITIEDKGSSSVKGLDLLINKRTKHFNHWLNYSLSQNILNFPDFQEEKFPSNINQLHRLSIINQWRINDFAINLSTHINSGLPTNDNPEILEFDEEEEEDIFYELDYDEFNDEVLPIYWRNDISLSYQTSFVDDKLQLNCSAQLINIFNRRNIFERNFLLNENELDNEDPTTIEIERFQLGRTFNFMVRLSYTF